MGCILEITLIYFLPALTCIIIFLFIRLRYLQKFGRFEIGYVFKVYKLKRYSPLVSFFYASFSSTFVFYISYANWLYTGGGVFDWFEENLLTHSAIFVTFLVGYWGLVVSYNVLKQQNNQIVSFRVFLSEVRDSLYRLSVKAVKNDQKTYTVYIYDYHPLIGNYSSREKYKEYKAALNNILDIGNIKVNLITNHEDALDNFFKKLSIDDDHIILENSFEASDFIKSVENLSKSALIWKGLSIAQFHFVIIEDEAFQYVVLPQKIKGENRNSLFGLKSEDPFTINYLQNSFKEKMAKTISPVKFLFKHGYFEIYFEPQSNIESIQLFELNSSDDKCFHTISKKEELIEYNQNDVQGFRIKEFDIKDFLPIQYKLLKPNGTSVKSHPIYYRELYNSVSDVHIIKYVLPELVPNKLESCLLQLEDINIGYNILSMTVFCDSTAYSISDLYKQIDESIFTEIPVQFVAQKPEKGISLELILVPSTNSQTIIYGKKEGFKFSKYTFEEVDEYYFSSKPQMNDKSLEDNIKDVFQNFGNTLDFLSTEKSNLKKSIFRQWNYISHITDRKEVDGHKVDNYDQFCKVRAEFYNKWELETEDYPVATGVHIDSVNKNEFGISAIVVSSDKRTISQDNLESTKQKFPYNYTEKVLSGVNKPFFNRAKRIKVDGLEEYLFVAGTASIKGEESYEDSSQAVLSQLNTTIESINHIINLNIPNQISIRNMVYLRIYYHSEDHLYELKTYLNPIISAIPHIFLKARICRDNLHLEIETGKF